MNWQQLPEHIRDTATSVLTEKQLVVFKLTLAGLGTRRISDMLLITRSTVRSHQHDAHIALEQVGIRRDASGRYYQKEAA